MLEWRALKAIHSHFKQLEEPVRSLMADTTPLHVLDLISILCILWCYGFIGLVDFGYHYRRLYNVGMGWYNRDASGNRRDADHESHARANAYHPLYSTSTGVKITRATNATAVASM